jgi:pimeloyl-ACP methyl ester carboxylesterase
MSNAFDTNGGVTVVLVHGAFADSSSWNDVIECLQAKGVKVTAAANPLRGISIDSAYIAGVFDETPGPVVAVGHSYGGAVITNAAKRAKNVAGLVFVAALAPDEGERLGEVEGVRRTASSTVRLSRSTTRPQTAASLRWSSRSIPRSSATRSRPTCRPRRQRSWPPRKDPSPSWRSPRRVAQRHGRTCRLGRSSPSATRLPERTSFDRWRIGPGPGSPRSKVPTRSWSRSRRPWPT